MGEVGNYYKILAGNQKGRDHLGDLSVDGRIMLKLMLKEILWMGVNWNQWLVLVNTVVNLLFS
jgi:hypothetical protein